MRMTKALKKQMLAIVEEGLTSINANGLYDDEIGDYVVPEWNTMEVAMQIIERLRLLK